MKPQLEHPMMGNRNKKEEAPELPVHTVMPAEDEERFSKQMIENEALFAAASAKPKIVQTDGILDREMKKREVFNKLVLLKQDCTTEVNIAGLVWKLKLLDSTDNEFVIKQIRKEAPEDQLLVMPLVQLAAAIVEVNGIRFEDFYSGPANIEDPILRRYYELRQWQRPVVNILQRAYTDFSLGVEKEYTKDFLVK